MLPPAPSVPDFAAALARVVELRDHFDAHRPQFMADAFKEAEARDQFITPLFEFLGWDVRNTARCSVYEKDVVIEQRENIAGAARSADYSFRRPARTSRPSSSRPRNPASTSAMTPTATRPSSTAGTRRPRSSSSPISSNSSSWTPAPNPTNPTLPAQVLCTHGAYFYQDCRDPDKFAELWGLFARHHVAAGSLDKAATPLNILAKEESLLA